MPMPLWWGKINQEGVQPECVAQWQVVGAHRRGPQVGEDLPSPAVEMKRRPVQLG